MQTLWQTLQVLLHMCENRGRQVYKDQIANYVNLHVCVCVCVWVCVSVSVCVLNVCTLVSKNYIGTPWLWWTSILEPFKAHILHTSFVEHTTRQLQDYEGIGLDESFLSPWKEPCLGFEVKILHSLSFVVSI